MNIGIDFGSTYSVFSKYNALTGNAEAIPVAEGEPASIPSVVSISKKGQVTTGKGAKDQAGKKTVRIFEGFKILLTEANREMLKKRGYDDHYSPREITRCYLESTLKGVLNQENQSSFENVVICVPEIWSENLTTLDGRMILRTILQKRSAFRSSMSRWSPSRRQPAPFSPTTMKRKPASSSTATSC